LLTSAVNPAGSIFKPTLAPPVDSSFYRHSLQSANYPPASYCLNIYFLFPISERNKEENSQGISTKK